MQLTRTSAPKTLISLVPMIDVMLILLVFFMVTSTYLNLDMITMVETSDDAPATTATPQSASRSPLLIRLGADGIASVRGQAQTAQDLTALIRNKLAQDPLASVIVLPSGAANTQSLVTVMDTATMAGATRLRLIRLEARP